MLQSLKHYFQFHYIWKFFVFILDALVIFGAFVAAYFIRLSADPVHLLGFIDVPPLIFSWEDYLNLAVPLSLVWVLLFFLGGLYHLEKTKELDEELYRVFSSLNTGIVVYILLTFVQGEQLVSRLILVYTWLLSLVFVSVERMLLRLLRRWLQRFGYGIKNVVVIGRDQTAEQLLEGFRHKKIWNYRIVGVITAQVVQEPTLCGFPIIGSLTQFKSLLRDHAVEEVMLTLSSLDEETVLEIINHCKEHNIRFTFVPDMLQLLASYHTQEMINGLPLITLRKTPLQGFNNVIKRGFDIVVSGLLIVLSSPLLLLLSFLVKWSSPGPLFIAQERMGLDGMTFHTLKFRSMYHDAEGKNGQFWTLKDDPRITPVGKWLRKLNLDELPQLFNVLKGEMSLVGPRPEQPRFVEEFEKKIPRYMDRYHVKAGMTGWAQVNGWRGDTSIEERVRYDIYYMENWSLWFDIRILFLTIFSMGS